MSDPVVPPASDASSDAVKSAKKGLAEAEAAADATKKAAADAKAAAATKVTPSEPVAAPDAPAPQPIFVQAPEPPRQRGNRATAALIGLIAAACFGILYFLARFGLATLARTVDGTVPARGFVDALLADLGTWSFWVPVVVFFLGFWLLGAVINRGRWALWVIFGLLVGLVAYVGHILGALFQAPFWALSWSQGWQVVLDNMFAPLALAALVFGRELTIWFGAWVARRGKHKEELNAAAQREYERTLEAGPVLSR